MQLVGQLHKAMQNRSEIFQAMGETMEQTVGVTEARTRFSELVDQVTQINLYASTIWV